jgi:hypothetical protein
MSTRFNRDDTALPLQWRVPNAPAAFLGRRTEVRAVEGAIRRGPLVVLVGPGGIGKTSLACAAVRTVFPRRASRAVMVGSRPGTPFRQTLVDVIRALGHVEARGNADVAMLAIDLVEARNAIVVLDDVHHVIAEVAPWLSAIACYARRGVWIATSRIEPRSPELAAATSGQVIHLGPISAAQLVKLARLLEPSITHSEATRIAKSAAGSPWKLRQLVSGRRAESDTTRTLLAALSVVDRPISEQALSGALGTSIKGATRDLVRSGMVETVGGGYRLHDVARPLVDATHDEALPMVTALSAGSSDDAIEALQLALQRGDEKRALSVCKVAFDAMLRAGKAATLWKLIGARQAPAFGSYKLRAAVQLADVKVTTVLDEPPKGALRDRLLWARALFVEAKGALAIEAAQALERDAAKSGDRLLTFWAVLQHAMSARVHQGPERGLLLLERASPVDDATRALGVALRAFWLAESGHIDEATRLLDRTAQADGPLETPLAEDILGGPLDFFVRYYRMAAFMECGHLQRAHDELTRGRPSLDADDHLRASYVQLDGIANLSIARGELTAATQILERLLRAAPSGATTYHTIARLLDVERRIAQGEFSAVPRDLARLLDETRETNALVHAWCIDTRERLDVVQAVRDELPLDHNASSLGSVAQSVLAMRRALRRARWRAHPVVPEPIDVEGTIVRGLALAVCDVFADGSHAEAHARHAVDVAVLHGWGIRECEARALLADVLIVQGEPSKALAEARALTRRAAGMTAPRFETDARFVVAMLEPPSPDVATLEALATAGDVSPCASRRARAILGDSTAPLDAMDERVLAATQQGAKAVILRLGATESSRRGWGLDARRAAVWLPDGKHVSLARHALLAKTLEVLARYGGEASFETLAREVWNRRVYHPLHDANRVRVTLHRLRALVEDDPRKPKRLVLVGSSYRFGDEPFTLVR